MSRRYWYRAQRMQRMSKAAGTLMAPGLYPVSSCRVVYDSLDWRGRHRAHLG